jgi:hypothetical protein
MDIHIALGYVKNLIENRDDNYLEDVDGVFVSNRQTELIIHCHLL